jgi:hypothetical protein
MSPCRPALRLEERFVGFGVHDNELVRAGRDECESIIPPRWVSSLSGRSVGFL